MAKFRFHVSTGFVGSSRSEVVEIDDEELEGKSGHERDQIIEETFQEWLWEKIDAGWSEVEE